MPRRSFWGRLAPRTSVPSGRTHGELTAVRTSPNIFISGNGFYESFILMSRMTRSSNIYTLMCSDMIITDTLDETLYLGVKQITGFKILYAWAFEELLFFLAMGLVYHWMQAKEVTVRIMFTILYLTTHLTNSKLY